MPMIEVGHWIADESGDLSRPRFWTVERQTPNFPNDVLAEVCAVISEPSVRASVMDIAPDFVTGLIQERQNLTTFCLQVTDYAQIALWLASTRGSADGHHLMRFWLNAVSTGLVNDFKWTTPVDTSALRLPVVDRAAPAALQVPYRDNRIAVRESDRQIRLHLCCDIFDRLRRQARPITAQRLVLVDGLTDVRGTKFDVAGLVPSHRYAGADWMVVDRSTPFALREALARFCGLASAASESAPRPGDDGIVRPETAGHAIGEPSPPFHQAEPDRAPANADRLGNAVLARRAIADAMDATIPYGAAGIERAMFVAPEQLARQLPREIESLPSSSVVFEIVTRACIVGRFPALAVELNDVFTDWLETVSGFDVGLHAIVLSELAQPLYDHCRRHAGNTAKILLGLDRQLDNLVARVELLPASLEQSSSADRLWSQADREALAVAFDRLSELETTSAQRDSQLLHAGMIFRIVTSMPTADVVDRAVRIAMSENSGMMRNLMARVAWPGDLAEVGAVAAADVRGGKLGEGRRLFGELVSSAGQASAEASIQMMRETERPDGNSVVLPIFNSIRQDR